MKIAQHSRIVASIVNILICGTLFAQRPDVVWTRAGHSEIVISVGLTPTGDRALTASLDGTVKLWDVPNGQMLFSVRPHGYAALSPDGQQFVVQAVGFLGGGLEIRSASDGSLIRSLGGGAFAEPAWSPDGQRIVEAGPSNLARIWDVESGALVHQLNGHSALVRCAAYAPSGAFVVSGGGFQGADNNARLWSAATGQLLHTLVGHSDYIFCSKVSPNSEIIATGSGDDTVKLWDAASGALIRTLAGSEWPIFDLAFSPDGTMLAAVDIGGPLRLWRVSDGSLQHSIALPFGGRSVDFSADGTRLIVGSSFGPVELRDAASGVLLTTLGTESHSLSGLAVSTDGRTLGYGLDRNSRGIATRVRARDGALIDRRELDVFINQTGVLFSPDTQYAGGLSMLSTDFQSFNLTTGLAGPSFSGHVSSIYEAAYSPDGTLFATAGEYQAGVWQADGTFMHWFQNDVASSHHAVSFSPDASLVAIGDRADVRVFNVQTAALVLDRDSGLPGVENAAFSPDGSRVAVAAEGGIRALRVSDGAILWTQQATRGTGSSLQFTRDGRHIVSSSRTGVIEIRRSGDGAVVSTFDQETGPWITSLTLGPSDRTILYTRVDATIVAARNPVWTVGDIDADGCTTLEDLALLLSDFGRLDEPVSTDLNDNGSTDLPDLAMLLGNFGECE